MSPADIAIVSAAVNGLAWVVAIDRRHDRNVVARTAMAQLAVRSAPGAPESLAGTVARHRTPRLAETGVPKILNPAAVPQPRDQYGHFASRDAVNGQTGGS